MKENNKFIQESRTFSPSKSSRVVFIKDKIGCYRVPQNLKSFFQSFMVFIDVNDDYYFYGEHLSCSKFIVKIVGNELRTVRLKDLKSVKVVKKIIGFTEDLNTGKVEIHYNCDEEFLVNKLWNFLECNSELIEKCLSMKESITICDDVESIPNEPTNMVIANEIEVFTGYTMKILTCPGFSVTVTPSFEHATNNSSFVVDSGILKYRSFDYKVFRR